ncbi:MAG: Terminase-like family protein [Chitinophagaceae bacterium]|nr:Terminase-like family protein [Chitinophagaceae bacterium]
MSNQKPPLPTPKPSVRKKVAHEEKAKTQLKEKQAKLRANIRNARKLAAKSTAELDTILAQRGVVDNKIGVVTDDIISKLPIELRDTVKEEDIIFRPNPGPQTQFLAATEKEVFYGGARGGGKSYAMLADPLRYCDNKNHRALILRRTMPELRDMIAKSQQLYPRAIPGAKWREQEKEWRFPSGARIEFGYCETDVDAYRYLGQSYSWIGVDELPLFPTPDLWNFLRSSLRSPDPTLPTFMRATGNPGCIGSAWVREMFIDPAPPNTRFTIDIEVPTPTGVIHSSISRRFVPATVFDNPYMTYDASYITMLASLPEIQRRNFLYGDWDAFDNAAFSDFKKEVHVIEPFEIPHGWQRFRAADWGYTSPACCLWFAVDYDNNLYAYRELYANKLTADRFAQRVLELEEGESIRYGVLDASAWAKRGEVGPSIAETMIANGCRWRPSDRSPNSRKSGKLELHRRLSLDEEGRPSLFIFSNCRNLIRTLPKLPLDNNNPEDVDTTAEDHAYDALRYGVSSRPKSIEMPWDMSNPTRRPGYDVADLTFGY